jgi:hypothetical protein
VLAAAAVLTAIRAPVEYERVNKKPEPRTLSIPDKLVIDELVPSMEEVLAKHLFVPERVATGLNSFPDLVVKGVYVGDRRNAVFSLKSRPAVNFRVWQGEEESALNLVEDEKDLRKPISDYLHEWQIKEIGFGGVVFEHMLTGEQETYAVDYTPLEKVKDSSGAGYGQGRIADSTAPAKSADQSSSTASHDALLVRIAGNDLPRGYSGSRHQEYVDRRLRGLTREQRARVGQLWEQKKRIDPNMSNRGQSFVRILEHVAEGGESTSNK